MTPTLYPALHIRVTRRTTTPDPDGHGAAITERNAIYALPDGWTTRQLCEHLETLGCQRHDNLTTESPDQPGLHLPDYP